MLLPQTLVSESHLGRTTSHVSNDSDRVTFDLDTVVVSLSEGNCDFASIPATSNSHLRHHDDRPQTGTSACVDFEVANTNHRHQKSVLDAEIAQCGYPLQNVKSQVDEHRITLEGRVSRYYYMQVVLQIAMRVCGGRQIVNKLDVVGVHVE